MSISDNRIFVNMFPYIPALHGGVSSHVGRVASLLSSLKFERHL